MKLGGALARRDNRPVGAYCPIERTLGVLSTRSAMLVLREAFYGATRFEEFAARADLTDATTSARLRELVRAGILDKQPYQEPRKRSRHEYVLTAAGQDLMPALFALLQWGTATTRPPTHPTSATMSAASRWSSRLAARRATPSTLTASSSQPRARSGSMARWPWRTGRGHA